MTPVLRPVQSDLPPVDLTAARRILVVKLDRLGDWVLCSPFLQNLRRSAPDAIITAVVHRQVFDLAAACRLVDRVIAVACDPVGRLTFHARTAAEAAAFDNDYRSGQFDLAVVPRWDADFDGAAQIAAASGAPLRLGFSERCTPRKCIINAGQDRLYTHVVEDGRTAHEVEHNLAMLTAMNARITTRRATLHLRGENERAAADFVARAFGPRPGTLVAVAPFASEPKRSVPVAYAASLMMPISDAFRCAVVVIGEAGQRAMASRLAGLIGAQCKSAAGVLSVGETAALIRRCSVMVAADSGPAHIAAAVGTPVVVLSCHPRAGSPDHPNSPVRFAPWGDAVLVLQPESARAPCRSCCGALEPHCLLNIREPCEPIVKFIGGFVG